MSASQTANKEHRSLLASTPPAWLAGGALCLLTLLVYLPTLRNGYVSDDSGYVVGNFALRSAKGLYDIWFTIGTVQQYYPMVFTMFWGEYHLWGLHPAGYHAVNLLLHAATAVLLWRVLVRLDIPGAWLAGAIFAVHPVEVESVAWISERKNVLSCALALAAMLAYWKFSPPEIQEDRPKRKAVRAPIWRYYALAMLFFVGALLSKTVTASLPAVLLVIVWWKRGRVTWADVRPLLPFFAVGIGLGMLTVWMEKEFVGAQGDRFQFTPIDRILIAGRAVWFYAGKLAWPYPLMFFYPRWKIDPHVWWQYLYPLGAVVLLFVLWKLRGRIGRGPLAAALIFGGVLVPAIGFFDVFPFRFSFVADHYQYHASVALIVLFAATLTVAVQKYWGQALWAMPAAAALVLVPLTVLAHQKTYVYFDDFTLHADVAKLNPDPWVAYNNLAGIYMKEKKFDQAIESLTKTIELIPNDPVPHANLGAVYTEMGRYDEALGELNRAMELHIDKDERGWILRLIADVQRQQEKLAEALENYNQAIELHPEWSAFMNRGQVRAMLGDTSGAESDLSLAIRLHPDSTDALEIRSKLYASIGQFDKALADLRTLEKLLPGNPELHLRTADVLQAAGRWNEAIAEYGRVLKSVPAEDPMRAAALLGRGHCDLALGRPHEAVRNYEAVLKLNPDDANAQNNLAWILATSSIPELRNGERAVRLATRACESSKFSRPDLLSTLAAAYAEAGDFAHAIDWAKKSLALATTPALKDELQRQLVVYERNRPWREPSPN